MLPTSTEHLIARFSGMPLDVYPGTVYRYNNSGYVLLGVIVERAAGQSYESFLRTRIFEPLEMNNTGYDRNAERIVDQAQGYAVVGDNPQEAPFLHASTLHAAGSLYSSIDDLHTWSSALFNGQIVPQPMLDEMFTPVLYSYGYGWKIETVLGRRSVGHPGFINGFSHYIARFPDDNVTIIVLSNLQTTPAQSINTNLAQIVFTGQPPDS
jgi:CubicO group peptidase (beta-lactamase class C family)